MNIGLRSNSARTGALLVTLMLTACGGSGSSTTVRASVQGAAQTAHADAHYSPSTGVQASTLSTTGSAAASEKVPNVSITMKSSVTLKPVSARYTCDGADISLPISWGKLPANTVEIDLFVFASKLVHEKLIASWAVAHLKPSLRKLSAGKVPLGAIVGRNSVGRNRYSLCPPKGRVEEYVIQLDPLPRRIPVKPGFDPEALANKAVSTAEFEGQLFLSYTRR